MTDRRGTAAAHTLLVVLLPILVLVQAALASQHLTYGDDITVHGIVGNVSFALTALIVVLVVVRRLPGSMFFLAVSLAALAFAQVGLGYVGRDTIEVRPWHITLGVALFGLSTFQLAWTLRSSQPGERAEGAAP